MGGVDVSDILIVLYRASYRTHRWYFAIFGHLLDICVNNGWLLHRRDVPDNCKTMSLKEFRLTLADELHTVCIKAVSYTHLDVYKRQHLLPPHAYYKHLQ